MQQMTVMSLFSLQQDKIRIYPCVSKIIVLFKCDQDCEYNFGTININKRQTMIHSFIGFNISYTFACGW